MVVSRGATNQENAMESSRSSLDSLLVLRTHQHNFFEPLPGMSGGLFKGNPFQSQPVVDSYRTVKIQGTMPSHVPISIPSVRPVSAQQ